MQLQLSSAGLAIGSSRELAINVHHSFQPVPFLFLKQQVSAALTVLTISTLVVNKEWSPDFHGWIFQWVPHPVPCRPNQAIIMGSVVPPSFVVSPIEVYSMAPWKNVGKRKRELCLAWEDIASLQWSTVLTQHIFRSTRTVWVKWLMHLVEHRGICGSS